MVLQMDTHMSKLTKMFHFKYVLFVINQLYLNKVNFFFKKSDFQLKMHLDFGLYLLTLQRVHQHESKGLQMV